MTNLRKTEKIMALTVTLMVFLILRALSAPPDFRTCGWIESVREGTIITALLEKAPDRGMVCLLVRDKKVLGTVEIMSTVFVRTGRYPYRVIASCSLIDSEDRHEISAGREIMLKSRVEGIRDYSEPFYREKIVYKKTIETHTDKRGMVLVKAGKFLFGSESGEKDESPARVTFLDAFYIDKYEVSNNDYYRYVSKARARAPLSWRKGEPDPGTGDLPVLVTFHEALQYAEWAGKRLPTEAEWEKAAKRMEYEAGKGAPAYPWGNEFKAERANSIELWSDKKSAAKIMKEYGVTEKGLLPVMSMGKKNASTSGAVNMSGNAAEWTSSWYEPYQGNRTGNSSYGRQYRVIRGGAWYHDRFQLRVTRRMQGGIPNLHEDNTAGFRCVKDTAETDHIR